MPAQAAVPQRPFVDLKVCLDDFPPRGLERRRYARVAINLPAFVNVDERSLTARCLNLSAGGALLRLDLAQAIPATFMLHLVLSSLGGVPVPVLARRIELSGRRVRLAFDPLPAGLERAIAAQVARKPSSLLGILN